MKRVNEKKLFNTVPFICFCTNWTLQFVNIQLTLDLYLSEAIAIKNLFLVDYLENIK